MTVSTEMLPETDAPASRLLAWRPRLRLPKWRRRKRPVQPIPLAGYVGSNFLKRHRRTCYFLLGFFSFFYAAVFSLFGRISPATFLLPFLMMAGLIIWILPQTDRAPVKLMYRLLVAFLVALLCWPDYLAFVPPGSPWITAARLTCFPLAAAMLIGLSQSPKLRCELSDILRETKYLTVFIVAFAVITLVSVVVSTGIEASMGKFIRAQTTWTLVFFASAYCYKQPGRATTFCYVLWLSALLLCGLAIWEARLERLPWLGHIPSIFQVDPDMLDQITTPKSRSASGVFRVQAVQTTPLGLAELLVLCTPFIIHIGLSARVLALRGVAFASLPLILYVITLTDARLGMIGFILTVMLYVLAYTVRRWRTTPSSVFAPIIVACYPAFFAAFLVGTVFIRRLHNIVWGSGAADSSTDARVEQWHMGIPKFLARPWGYGIGRSGGTLGWVSEGGVGSIDSYYLSLLLDFGLAGLAVFVAMLISALVYGAPQAWRAKGPETQILSPLMIALFNFMVIKAVLSQDANHPLIFMMLGMVAALVYRARLESSIPPAVDQASAT